MYRIQQGGAYSGCIPTTVWFVQKHINICCVYDGWVNIKGYDSYDKAKRLLHILNGKEKLWAILIGYFQRYLLAEKW